MAEAFAGLFEKAQQGDSFARDAVYKLAFHRLRVIASALLRRKRPGHPLQPTAPRQRVVPETTSPGNAHPQ